MHAFRSYIFAAQIACDSGPTCLLISHKTVVFMHYLLLLGCIQIVYEHMLMHTSVLAVCDVISNND